MQNFVLFGQQGLVGGVAQWLGRRSVAGGLSLSTPDLWLTGKASSMGQPTRPTQPW